MQVWAEVSGIEPLLRASKGDSAASLVDAALSGLSGLLLLLSGLYEELVAKLQHAEKTEWMGDIARVRDRCIYIECAIRQCVARDQRCCSCTGHSLFLLATHCSCWPLTVPAGHSLFLLAIMWVLSFGVGAVVRCGCCCSVHGCCSVW